MRHRFILPSISLAASVLLATGCGHSFMGSGQEFTLEVSDERGNRSQFSRKFTR